MIQASPEGEETALIVQPLADEDAVQRVAQNLHSTIHVRGDALWKLF